MDRCLELDPNAFGIPGEQTRVYINKRKRAELKEQAELKLNIPELYSTYFEGNEFPELESEFSTYLEQVEEDEDEEDDFQGYKQNTEDQSSKEKPTKHQKIETPLVEQDIEVNKVEGEGLALISGYDSQ